MKDFLLSLLGMPWTQFLSVFFFVLVGITISLLVDSMGRDTKSTKTPSKFSWKFLLLDNLKRIFLVVLVIFVSIRFYTELYEGTVNEWAGLLLGLSLDFTISVLRDRVVYIKGLLTPRNRDKLTKKYDK